MCETDDARKDGAGVAPSEDASESLLLRERERVKLLLELYERSPDWTDQEIYDYALERAVALTDSSIGYLHRVNEDQVSIRLTTWNKEALKHCTASFVDHYPLDEAGVWADSARFKRPAIHNDYPSLPTKKGLPEGHSELIRHLSIPVVRENKVSLILGVGNKRDPYDDNDVLGLQLVANELQKVVERNQIQIALARANEELERRVRERTQELEDAIQELEAFSYSVSHDLRAPLRAMNGYCALILEDHADGLDETARSYLQRVVASSDRMAGLLDGLLTLARISRQDLKLVKVDLSSIAREVADLLSGLSRSSNAVVEIQPNVFALGDSALVYLLMKNLFDNAVKYSSKQREARIEFGVVELGQEPVYFVRDNGVGFDMSFKANLFLPFQRLHSTSEFPGIGIGLATAQRIVRRHGGDIWAESAPGEGATFFFTLAVRPNRPGN